MNGSRQPNSTNDLGLEQLTTLPTVPASEFFNDWQSPVAQAGLCPKPQVLAFASDQEYRLCKAIDQNPLHPSSTYPKLAGVSSKMAGSVRRKLVVSGYIREHLVDSSRRGRSAIVLEILPAGKDAIAAYESGRNGCER